MFYLSKLKKSLVLYQFALIFFLTGAFFFFVFCFVFFQFHYHIGWLALGFTTIISILLTLYKIKKEYISLKIFNNHLIINKEIIYFNDILEIQISLKKPSQALIGMSTIKSAIIYLNNKKQFIIPAEIYQNEHLAYYFLGQITQNTTHLKNEPLTESLQKITVKEFATLTHKKYVDNLIFFKENIYIRYSRTLVIKIPINKISHIELINYDYYRNNNKYNGPYIRFYFDDFSMYKHELSIFRYYDLDDFIDTCLKYQIRIKH